MDEVSQAIGQLQAGYESLEKKVDSVDSKMDTVLDYIAQQRGARKVLGIVTVGGGTSLGALIGYALTWWASKPP